MNNYQLDNTSVYLSGQCKWDIVVNRDSRGELYIDNFQLTPLSPIVPFTNPGTNIIHNPHSYNLTNFYKSIQGYFWNTDYIEDKNSKYDTSRYAGVRRNRNYTTYNKQFSILVPVWLEKLTDEPLTFTFLSYSDQEKTMPLSKSTLVFSDKDNRSFHNQFINYINNWFVQIGINNGNDKVCNVNFSNRTFAIDGIDVNTGLRSGEISIDDMMENFTMTERPLIDTDNLITTSFRKHNIVCSQLFNFNFNFNLSDILDPIIEYNWLGSKVWVDCVVSLGDNVLDRTALQTNYEFISKTITDDFIMVKDTDFDYDSAEIIKNYTDENITTDIKTNVLDYLEDYNYPDFQIANKLTQDIVHWGYVGGSRRTFNLYNGYRGIMAVPTFTRKTTIDGIKYPCNSYYNDSYSEYGLNPDQKIYSKTTDGLGWIAPGKVLYVNDGEALTKFSMYKFDYFKKYGCSIDQSQSYWGDTLEQGSFSNAIKKTIMIYSPENMNEIISMIYDSRNCIRITSTGCDIVYDYATDHGYLIILSSSLDKLMLYNLISQVSDSGSSGTYYNIVKDYLDAMRNMLIKNNNGTKIVFENNLFIALKADEEITYIKRETNGNPPIRMDGSLSPKTGIKENNFIYRLNSQNEIISFSKDRNSFNIDQEGIYPMSCGCVRELYETLDITLTLDPGEEYETYLKEYLKTIYPHSSDSTIKYIYNLYSIKVNYDRTEDCSKVVYEIKMKLL